MPTSTKIPDRSALARYLATLDGQSALIFVDDRLTVVRSIIYGIGDPRPGFNELELGFRGARGVGATGLFAAELAAPYGVWSEDADKISTLKLSAEAHDIQLIERVRIAGDILISLSRNLAPASL